MKKLLLLLIVLMPGFAIFGQTTKGKFVLSGGTNLQFSSSNSKPYFDGISSSETKTNSFSLTPSLGYFVMDNLAIGFSGDFSISSQKTSGFGKGSGTSIAIMPMAMYYFPMEGKIRPLLQIGAGYSTMDQKYNSPQGGEDKYSYNGFAYNFGGGIAYFIAENISLDFGVSYTKINLKNDDNNKEETRTGNLGGSVGISIFL